jgi:serine phosphatase RsbU (regulator of sigma subunit)
MSDDSDSACILIVDDNEANRDLLARRLQRQGHRTAMAENGRVALEMLQREPFDLLLLDIMMPEMTGFELLEHTKADPVLKHIPVILISALDDIESITRGIAMGADDHLPKPFNTYILNARVSASLARKRLHDREQMHARSLEREMDIARDIQSGFLPDHLPAIDGMQLAAWFQPARRVGGDFYDAFELPGGARIAVVVADVCDKGVGAALFMALVRSLVRALAERMLTADGDTAVESRQLIEAVNDYITRTHERANMFATLFFAVLDVHTGALVYVNGGHEPPIITGALGVRTELAPSGPAVGMMPALSFDARSETLAPGETLIMSTDGVTDAHDGDGVMFSHPRLLELVAPAARSANAMVERIRDAVQAHVRDAAQFDDITLLVLHRVA